ncbi:hypothetical protein CCUG60885_04272 [Mycobacteroides salmoniphilum]|uniref:DUF3168 domain-containing protein n=1 Tax=Mycobacteroides salmoniphilum TaxID=404941 RepID=A0A4R8SC14_9MYCO|nr:hypothetical protein CCUG60885_04272 [Mycobacteroides salmoniphilum]TEA07387.1 hypothetical protein CCUG60883_01420 [Mycobacteroides salmoniphilum]
MFPYAPKVVRDYLAAQTGVRVSGDVPTNRPTPLITVSSAPIGPELDGVKQRILSKRRLIIQCWHANEIAAGELAEQVRDLLLQAPYEHIGIRRVNIIGEPAKWNEPGTGSPRFQLTVDVLLRAS